MTDFKATLRADVLDHLWPHAPAALKAGMVSTSAAVFAKYGIGTLADMTDFMAEISEETAGGIALSENLDYSAARLVQVWPGRFPSLAAAAPFAHNPRALANYVYARYGNVPGTNDGWNFRGRGLIQITFRGVYAEVAKATGLDLVGNPDLVSDPLHALECAAAYWQVSGVNALANSGNFIAEVRRINGGLTNMDARNAWRSLWHNALTETQDMHPAGYLIGSPQWAQSQLLKAGFDPQGVDGSWGPDSRAALHAFEIAKGLTVDDGELGPQTIAALKLI